MLSKDQEIAVREIENPLMIRAGPGTGKTFTIVEKIIYLLDKGIKEDEILVLTFNDKAAEEITQRVKEEWKKNVIAKTFHSFAQETIENNINLCPNISKGFKILEESDSLYFFYKNFEDFKISSIEIGNRKNEIIYSLYGSVMRLKENGVLPKDLEKMDFLNYQIKLDLFISYVKYEAYKNKKNFLDFSDLLLSLRNLLKTNKNLKEKIKSQFKYILIDEFQDTNNLQYEIIKLISNNKICVVGDKKQAIYGFRGTNIQIWEKFRQEYGKKGLIEIFLKENYRSSNEVIEIINQTIFDNKEKLICSKNKKGNSQLYEFENKETENNYLIKKIIEKFNEKKTIGVLFRTTHELDKFSEELKKKKIKHTKIGTENLKKNPFIKEIISTIKIIDNTNETLDLFYILKRGPIHKETLRKLIVESQKENKSLYEYILGSKSFEEINISGEEENFIKEFIRKIDKIKTEFANHNRVTYLIEEIFNLLRIYQRVEERTEVDLFKGIIEKIYDLYGDIEIEEFLEILEFSKNPKISSNNEDFEGITLLTYHQAKGKEFDIVFMPTLNERRFPLVFRKNFFQTPFDLDREKFLEEEERLFFVGLSRAKEELYLSYVHKFLENKLVSNPSKFLLNLNLKPIKISKEDCLKYYFNEEEEKIYSKKKELINKINRAIEFEEFNLAKKNLELLEKISTSKIGLFNYIKNDGKDNKIEEIYSKEDKLLLEFDPSKTNYSVSRIQTYESCPKKYLYQYIYKLPTKPRHYFDFGTSIHSVLENMIPEFKITSNFGELYEKALLMLDKYWISKGYESLEQELEYKKKGKEALKKYIKRELEILKENRKNLFLEKKFEININSKKFTGFIDRIDEVNGSIEILDYKTSNSMELDSKIQENMQLNVYAIAIKELFGKFPKKASLWYLIHDKIKTIEINEQTLEKIKEKINSLITQIESKNFEPKPSDFTCKFCDFNKICENSKYNF